MWEAAWQIIAGICGTINWGGFAAVYVPLNLIGVQYLLRAQRKFYIAQLGKAKICRGCYRLMLIQNIANWQAHFRKQDEDARQAMQELPVSSLPAGSGGAGDSSGMATGTADSQRIPMRVAPDRAVPWVGRFPEIESGGTGGGGGGTAVQGARDTGVKNEQ